MATKVASKGGASRVAVRERMLDAAEKSLLRDGFAALSTRAVAQGAGRAAEPDP